MSAPDPPSPPARELADPLAETLEALALDMERGTMTDAYFPAVLHRAAARLRASAPPPAADVHAALRWLDQGCRTVSALDKDVAIRRAVECLRGNESTSSESRITKET